MVIILIPAYNPKNSLLEMTRRLINSGFKNIVIVDDGSDCNSEIFLKIKNSDNNIHIIRHFVNWGKGRALKTGINYILNEFPECDGVVTVDADGQHSIEDVKRIADYLEQVSRSDNIILGCRSIQKDNTVKIPLRSKIGNLCTKYVLRYLCNIQVSDSQTGLRAIPFHLLPKLLTIKGERYEYETNMLMELMDDEVRFLEMPIQTIYEDNNSTSHFNPIKDSLKIYAVILKYSMASLLSGGLDNIIFIFLTFFCNNIWLMTFIARSISSIFNFTLNKKVVFKKNGNVLKQSIKYFALVFGSGTVSAGLVWSLHNLCNANIILLKIIVEVFLYFINFYIQKNYIFKNDRITK